MKRGKELLTSGCLVGRDKEQEVLKVGGAHAHDHISFSAGRPRCVASQEASSAPTMRDTHSRSTDFPSLSRPCGLSCAEDPQRPWNVTAPSPPPSGPPRAHPRALPAVDGRVLAVAAAVHEHVVARALRLCRGD
jgi:hypothetical protein